MIEIPIPVIVISVLWIVWAASIFSFRWHDQQSDLMEERRAAEERNRIEALKNQPQSTGQGMGYTYSAPKITYTAAWVPTQTANTKPSVYLNPDSLWKPEPESAVDPCTAGTCRVCLAKSTGSLAAAPKPKRQRKPQAKPAPPPESNVRKPISDRVDDDA